MARILQYLRTETLGFILVVNLFMVRTSPYKGSITFVIGPRLCDFCRHRIVTDTCSYCSKLFSNTHLESSVLTIIARVQLVEFFFLRFPTREPRLCAGGLTECEFSCKLFFIFKIVPRFLPGWLLYTLYQVTQFFRTLNTQQSCFHFRYSSYLLDLVSMLLFT